MAAEPKPSESSAGEPQRIESASAERPKATRHEAELESGPAGRVLRGSEIGFDTAVARRRAGRNVVVCGDDMKFFTAELIAMGQSDDDRVLNEQDRLWNEAGDRYVAYLDAIRPRLPTGLKQIDENYYLHDAVIRVMGRRFDFFVITLQLDTPPQSILTFEYDLVEDPIIAKDALPEEFCGTGTIVDWQYDEIEMIPGDPPTWRQSILLSNGWELALHFRDVQVQEVQAVFPAPRNGAAAGEAFVLQHAAP